MKSTTRERLAACRSVRDWPTTEELALLDAEDRVYAMRGTLYRVLVNRKNWPVSKAADFAYANGYFWS